MINIVITLYWAIPGWVIQKTQKMVLDASYLTLSIIRYGSRVSGVIQEKELHPYLHLGVVAGVVPEPRFGSKSS